MKSSCVTVVITTFNSAKFIEDSVASVRDQDFPDISLLAVDNNSTDDTLLRLSKLDVDYITEGTQGAGAARNRGLNRINTEFVLFLDSDDRLLPTAISNLVHGLLDSPALAVYGRVRNVHLDGREALSAPKMASIQAPLASSTLFRLSVFSRFGEFDHDNYSFIRWIVNARDGGARFDPIDSDVALRGVHGANVSLQEDSMAEFFKIIRGRSRSGNQDS